MSSLIPVSEYRVDAMLMAVEDSNRSIDHHEPREVEIHEARIDGLLQALEAAKL
jgi:hypothetical protein